MLEARRNAQPSNGVYDAIAFDDLVNKLWRAANVDINQLSLAAGHPDVKERLGIVKDRLAQLRQQSCEDLRDKIIAIHALCCWLATSLVPTCSSSRCPKILSQMI